MILDGPGGEVTHMGLKCSMKHDKNRDSAKPTSPVAADGENVVRSMLNLITPRLLFLVFPTRCLDDVRGRPSFRLVEYVHSTPARAQRPQGVSPEHFVFLLPQLSQDARSGAITSSLVTEPKVLRFLELDTPLSAPSALPLLIFP